MSDRAAAATGAGQSSSGSVVLDPAGVQDLLHLRDSLSMIEERFARLSGREREVLALVAAGLLSKQIGFRLGISTRTVEAHRANIRRKMDARNTADLILIGTALSIMQGRLPAPAQI